MNELLYQSIYAPYIKELISFKKALGFKYMEEAKILRRFDTFIIKEKITHVGITKELFEKWRDQISEESDNYKYARCVCLNQLAIYLNNTGIVSYVSRLPKRRNSFVPYIFSKQEIGILFEASNRLETNRKKMNSVIFSIPILLRFLYATGLRIGEALSLNNGDVNLIDNFLKVKDSKNGKERLIPLSKTLSISCKEYVEYKEKLSQINISTNSPFFVSLNGARYTQSEAYHWFRIVLGKSGIPFTGSEHKHRGPRIHDLRHTAACHALVQMAENGMDLYCSLPILSAYLGHQSLKATDLYVRLTAEMYPELIHKMDMECLTVFPNIKYENNGLL
jgi:integrase